ncbi:MAG TPA: 2-amino-4-hydroxy-6-hydroxymethyldihydropteridine diphosphokinase [Dehalococcoidia bacterium]|nr:2-amino-4-hydroxy-6-hydroxymethyldihydropteridine diphosphokinase [Dehalococcoidia bacterium]
MAIAYLGLGSNLGDRKQNLAQALELMSQHLVVEQVSSIYETEPVGYERQPRFLNLVCRVSVRVSPEQLLHLVKKIEAKMGRRSAFRNAPRVIDIDILFYNGDIVSSGELTIPHSRLAERAFVLVPLAEIAPDMVHPGNGKAIKELLAILGEVSGVCRYADAPEL